MIINIMHLLLLVTFTVNETYIQPSGLINSLPSNFILAIYTTIISLTFGVTVIFFIKNLWQKFISSSKNSVSNTPQK